MQRIMCKSKLHRARVTDADLNYEGSLTIDRDLMDAANLVAFEQIQIYNINNGSRAESYVIEGKRGSGEICVNGALARLAQKGDLLIVVAFALIHEAELDSFKPKIIILDDNNHPKHLS